MENRTSEINMDFDQWWREFGQFTGVCGQLIPGPLLDGYKQVAKAAFDNGDGEADKARQSKYDEGWDDCANTVKEALKKSEKK